MLVLVALAAVFRALLPGAPERGDRGALAIFVAVLATLAALSVVPVALPA
jgi:hypothetical protein